VPWATDMPSLRDFGRGTIDRWRLFYRCMKKLIIDTVKELRNKDERRKIILRSAIASARIEGIELSSEALERISKRTRRRLKK